MGIILHASLSMSITSRGKFTDSSNFGGNGEEGELK